MDKEEAQTGVCVLEGCEGGGSEVKVFRFGIWGSSERLKYIKTHGL